MKNKQTKIFTLAALLALANACKKDPIPEPNPAPNPVPTDTVTPITPTDTITPIVPGDTITPTPGDTIVPEPPMPMDTVSFFINLKDENIQYPSVDTIKKYKDKVVVLKWKIPPNVTGGWTPNVFTVPRDRLKPIFALPQQIFGSGKIYVNKNYGGASIPCEDSLTISKLGMTECDSAIFAGWGFEPYVKYSKSQREEHFKMLDTIGMSRAILGKQH